MTVKSDSPAAMALPPKAVRTQVIKAGGASGDGRPLTRSGQAGALAAGHAGLPVLDAFQEFLDVERNRTRTRILALSAVFLVLFVLLGGAAFVGGMLFYSRMSSDMLDVRDNVAALEAQALETRQRVQASLEDDSAARSAFREELDRRTQTYTLEKAGLADAVDRTDGELRALRDALARLAEENRVIREDLERARNVLPVLSANLESMRHQIADRAAQEPAPPRESGGADIPEAVAFPSALTVFIQPRGLDQAVPWRLPLP